MSLTQEKIASLKKLTALTSWENLSIDSVLDSFRSLEKVNIDPNTVISRSGKGTLLPREDLIIPSLTSSDDLLHCSHERVLGHQIALGSIMQGE
jgi:Asp-tRNA(Asn)/Glu-tRNA(Gln) amidotransferase C subunit